MKKIGHEFEAIVRFITWLCVTKSRISVQLNDHEYFNAKYSVTISFHFKVTQTVSMK